MRVPVYIQKRHIHLSQIDAEKLFGKWYVFLLKKKFTQPWEYFTEENITIKGAKWQIENIDIIMPYRKFTQVEILESDNKILWINAKITPSWNLKDAEPLILIWPKWNIYLEHTAIISENHIHMSVAQSKDFGFKHNQYVNVRIPRNNNKIINHVKIKTNDKYEFDFHLNSDEGAKFWLKTNDRAEIIQIKED